MFRALLLASALTLGAAVANAADPPTPVVAEGVHMLGHFGDWNTGSFTMQGHKACMMAEHADGVAVTMGVVNGVPGVFVGVMFLGASVPPDGVATLALSVDDGAPVLVVFKTTESGIVGHLSDDEWSALKGSVASGHSLKLRAPDKTDGLVFGLNGSSAALTSVAKCAADVPADAPVATPAPSDKPQPPAAAPEHDDDGKIHRRKWWV